MKNKFTEYKGLNLTQVANDINNEWTAQNTFQKSIETREGKKPFIFFEGPPSANGLPGIHHVMGRTIKDIFCRYKTLKGFQVKRKAGWDTHGLPVELGVEKALEITKEDIGTKISVEEYNEACKKAVLKYTNIWNDLTDKMGYWVDMENPYITYKSKYMESVWWLLAQIYKKDLMYKGYTIQPYSPKAGTGLSTHEINQPGAYQYVTDTTVVAQFKAIKENLPEALQTIKGDFYFLAWTTTPWTLPSNTALTVGKKIDYVLVKTFNQYTFEPIQVILAENLVGKQFKGKYQLVEQKSDLESYSKEDKKIPYIVLKTFKGSDLLGVKYEQLLPFCLPAENAENAFQVISGDFVTTKDGTGIVHTAPTFGADDALVAKQAGVPPMLVKNKEGDLIPLIDLQGRFTEHVGTYAGMYVKNEYYAEGEAPEKSVDVQIAIQLKIENKAFRVEKYKHNYPHCWRTNKPILYYPLDSWFIKSEQVRDKMHDLNQTINWKPSSTGDGRFGNWLKNANDWNLSRSRYWGIPIPIWRSEDGSEELIIESIAQLKSEMQKAIDAGVLKEDIYAAFVVGDMSDENYEKIDLHKNIVDQVILVSSTGKAMKRESDLIDVWFDSGSMPYAQWHYPFENKELIDKNKFYPADFIAEGVDQTRGWFYTLHAIGTIVFDSVAYKNVVSNGLVLDKNGKKMSKSLGNGVEPFQALETYGADAIRWYMISNANPWDNLKFDEEGVLEVKRKFFGTLYNTYSFFSLYANLDGFTFEDSEIPLRKRSELDQWIISELNTLIKEVEAFYETYEPTKAARAITNFVNDNLSNWYVRLNRRRFWKGEYTKDKKAAYQTLYTCLNTITKLGSPIAPFYMDQLYNDLNKVSKLEAFESVHLAEFPKADESLINANLQERTHLAQKITSMTFSLRKKEQIKVRQPLQKIIIPVLDEQFAKNIALIEDIIKQEVNVKELKLLTETEAKGLLTKKIKPNFKSLGKKLGKHIKVVTQKVAQFTQEDIQKVQINGYELELEGEKIQLTSEDFEISTKDIEGWLLTTEGALTVALDIQLTDELRWEGIARELVNRIQNIRKESDFGVTDKINIEIQKEESIEKAITYYRDYICSETLANELKIVEYVEGESIEFDTIKSTIKALKI